MTSYINELDFRKCSVNNLSTPYPFSYNNKNNSMSLNEEYNISNTNIFLKRVAINDTFHDLSKERAGYDKEAFNEKGPANFLLSGSYVTGDFITQYKKQINYAEYGDVKSKSFESSVTKSFEIKHGLQSSDVVVTYDEIIAGFNSTTFTLNDNLKNKIKISNGSISLCVNTNNSVLSDVNTSNLSFAQYITALYGDDENRIKQSCLTIASFIRWYLHSKDLLVYDDLLKENFHMTLPTSSMKILSDAGIGFMSDLFGIPESNTTPFVGIPCFLDSANTSIKILDPNIPIVFEQMPVNRIVPIVSNYFSCNEYFFGYVLNNDVTLFDMNNLFSFSLVVFKIPSNATDKVSTDIKNAVNLCKTADYNSDTYNVSCEAIYTYITTYPALIARYYFGELKKNTVSSEEYELPCGTCGAGVPYIGKITQFLIDFITKKYTTPTTNITGNWSSEELTDIKQQFDALKQTESLNSRIPICDGRMLHLFRNQSADNNTFAMSYTDCLSLFKIIADYKRTGDYQQSYTVLKQIINEKSNVNCYTFSSGDELSTLIGRLLGVPSIYQVGVSGMCKLFRCDLHTATPEQQLQFQLKNNLNIAKNYVDKIKYKLAITCHFITKHYMSICILRHQLDTLFHKKYAQYNKVKVNIINSSPLFFLLIQLANSIFVLSELINMCNLFVTYDKTKLESDISSLVTYSSLAKKINNPTEVQPTSIQTQDMLNNISKFEETSILFTLFNKIATDYPIMLNDDFSGFNIINNEPNNNNFKCPLLGLHIVNGNNKSREIKSMIDLIEKLNSTPSSRQQRERINAAKQQNLEINKNIFANEYNAFTDLFKSTLFSKNNITTDIKINNVSYFNQTYIDTILELIYVQYQQFTPDSACGTEQLGQIKAVLDTILEQFKMACDVSMGGEKRKTFEVPTTSSSSSSIASRIVRRQIVKTATTPQDKNKKYLYLEIQKIVLKTLNKCSVYISNTSNFTDASNPADASNDVSQILTQISNLYQTDNFCEQLLFEQDDEYGLDSENIGFLVALKLLSSKYSYSDLLQSNQVIDNGVTVTVNVDDIITVNHMLAILQLDFVRLIYFLLSWNNSAKAVYIMDFIGINNENPATIIINYFKNYEDIFNHLTSSQNNNILAIFSIMSLGLLNYAYYGKTAQCFNSCNEFKDPIGSVSKGIIYESITPKLVVKDELNTYLLRICLKLSLKLGMSPSAMGVASSVGNRMTKRKIYGDNSSSSSGGNKHKISRNMMYRKIYNTRTHKIRIQNKR